MRKLKHSKFKNPAVLFELLVRQITSDTLNNKDSAAVGMLKKYFSKNSELNKELLLYRSLTNEGFKTQEKANYLIEAVVSAHSKLNKTRLNRLKYNLIKEIRKSYDIDEFFKSKITDYRLLASVYKLFEYTSADNPVETVNNRFVVLEHITRKREPKAVIEESIINSQDKDIRLLSQKILIDKFNQKYSDLNTNQKNILREYINSVSETSKLKEFIVSESKGVRKEINQLIPKVTDKVTKIKLTEVVNLLKRMDSIKTVKDLHILSLLRYHELIKELKKI